MASPFIPPKTQTQAPAEEGDRVIVTAGSRTGKFGINEFRSEINLNGVLQTNRFLVIISMPKGLRALTKEFGSFGNDKFYTDVDDFLIMRCESAQIPGVQFLTQDDIRRHGIGQFEKRPYLPIFNPVRLQFIVDRNAKVVKFFHDWTNAIVGYNTDLGMSPNKDSGLRKPYLLTYPDNYMSPTVRIWVYNPHNIQSFGAKLYTAYPLITSDTDLNWGSENEMMKLSVNMQFTHMSQQFKKDNGEVFEADALEAFGITAKSNEEVFEDSLGEYNKPSVLGSIYNQTEKIIQGEIYSGVERNITKIFDRIFK
jgi:hypothetical protein